MASVSEARMRKRARVTRLGKSRIMVEKKGEGGGEEGRERTMSSGKRAARLMHTAFIQLKKIAEKYFHRCTVQSVAVRCEKARKTCVALRRRHVDVGASES